MLGKLFEEADTFGTSVNLTYVLRLFVCFFCFFLFVFCLFVYFYFFYFIFFFCLFLFVFCFVSFFVNNILCNEYMKLEFSVLPRACHRILSRPE